MALPLTGIDLNLEVDGVLDRYGYGGNMFDEYKEYRKTHSWTVNDIAMYLPFGVGRAVVLVTEYGDTEDICLAIRYLQMHLRVMAEMGQDRYELHNHNAVMVFNHISLDHEFLSVLIEHVYNGGDIDYLKWDTRSVESAINYLLGMIDEDKEHECDVVKDGLLCGR